MAQNPLRPAQSNRGCGAVVLRVTPLLLGGFGCVAVIRSFGDPSEEGLATTAGVTTLLGMMSGPLYGKLLTPQVRRPVVGACLGAIVGGLFGAGTWAAGQVIHLVTDGAADRGVAMMLAAPLIALAVAVTADPVIRRLYHPAGRRVSNDGSTATVDPPRDRASTDP